jgi:hypothetical protein
MSNLQKRIDSKLTELRKKKRYTNHEDFVLDHDILRIQYWRIAKGRANLTIKSLLKLLTIS